MPAEFEPTKANLIQLKGDLRFAKEGFEILDHKREILLLELSRIASQYDAEKEKLAQSLSELYKNFDAIRRLSGPLSLTYETMQKPGSIKIDSTEESIMGVHVAQLHASKIELPLHVAHGAEQQSDCFALEYAKMIPLILSFAQTASSLRRIAREAVRTQKRQKALENIHIPSYQKGITFISESIEENERDELIRYKKLKKKISAK